MTPTKAYAAAFVALLVMNSACAAPPTQPAIPPTASPIPVTREVLVTRIVTEVVLVTQVAPSPTAITPVATPGASPLSVAVIEAADFPNALLALEHVAIEGATISPLSTAPEMAQYDVVWLPAGWAEYMYWFDQIESHPQDFLEYVHSGGGLFVEQPNPFHQPDDTFTSGILPYPITISNWYDALDWPPELVDPSHPITAGLSREDMPFPADQVVSGDPAYTTLVRGKKSQSPSLLVAEYGAGRIVIFLDSAFIPVEFQGDIPQPSLVVLARALSWLSHDDE